VLTVLTRHNPQGDLMIRRLLSVLAVMAAVMPALAVGSPVHAATAYTYPGNCPGTASLQACIDSVNPGDGIRIDTDDLSTDAVTIHNSVHLSASSGFHPKLAAAAVVDDGGAPISVSLQGLAFSNAIQLTLSAQSGDVVTLDHVAATDVHYPLYADVQVAATLNVTNSHFHIGSGHEGIGMAITTTAALLTAHIVGNTVDGRGETATGPGIQFYGGGTGAFDAQIANNVISRVGSSQAGFATSILLWVNGSTAASRGQVVGNTLDHAPDGLAVSSQPGTGGHLGVTSFNNVITNISKTALYAVSDAKADLSYVAGYNDFYRDASNFLSGYSAGTHNLHVAPAYVDAGSGNYRLRSTSPLTNAGMTCSPAGIAAPDAQGNDRVSGHRVDIGAYERGASQTSGQAFVGTSAADTFTGGPGNDVLCGYGGGDTLTGAGGADYIGGGPGADQLFGGNGPDVIFGGAGNDEVVGGAANDWVYGDGGADEVVGNAGADHLYGGTGNDPCIESRDGVSGNDVDSGGSGTDRAYADSGDVKSSIEGSCHPA
jgi:Ca2+-binding RTX toxin-like protein